MAVRFSDREIAELMKERKPLPDDWRKRLALRSKRGHREANLDVIGDAGNEFKLILRQSELNVLDFSVGLSVRLPGTSRLFRLRRHNGKSHEHKNQIEGQSFYDFHIHMATERYQELGMDEDAYALPTDRYSDYDGAVRTLIADAHLVDPSAMYHTLFDEV